MRHLIFALVLAAACTNGADVATLSLEDELALRELRQDFHVARATGDYDRMRSLWADDAVLTTSDGTQFVGGDAITDLLATDPSFGGSLVVTTESRWRAAVRGDVAEYGFESVAVDVGGNDPASTSLALDGAQNPDVTIVGHSHSTGRVARTADGRWVFQELTGGHGPLPPSALAQTDPLEPGLGDEVGFRRMRETFHLANITGDAALLRTVWADDAVFRGGPNEVFGVDAIVEFFTNNPDFGRVLVMTPEASQRFAIDGDFADYAFECITIDVGGNDPLGTSLCSSDGAQNPEVEIVRHTHSMGRARRVADGRWVFQEFNGFIGPIPPAAPE